MIKIQNKLKQDSSSIQLNDILKIKNALLKTGHYKIPKYGLTPYPDSALFQGIKDFQTDMGLKIDGIINPNGKTINALNQLDKDIDEDLPKKSPTIWCPTCGGPHGGSAGDQCPDCASK